MTFIIYPKDDNSIVLVMPTGELPIEDVARRDIPAGRPYLFIEKSQLPLEHDDLFDAWEADFSNPDGYSIGMDAWIAEQAAKENA